MANLGDPITCDWCHRVGPARVILNQFVFDDEQCWDFWLGQRDPKKRPQVSEATATPKEKQDA